MKKQGFRPTAEQRKLVLDLTTCALTQEEVRQCIPWGTADGKPISIPTLRKHFAQEIERGHALQMMRVKKRAFEMVMEGNVPMTIFWLKTRAGWAETMKVENTGADGTPLPAAGFINAIYLPQKDVQEPLQHVIPGSGRSEARLPAKGVAPEPVQCPALAAIPAPPRAAPEPTSRAVGNVRSGTDFYPSAAELFRR